MAEEELRANELSENESNIKVKKPKLKKALLITLISIVSLIVIASAAGFMIFQHYYGLMNNEESDVSDIKFSTDENGNIILPGDKANSGVTDSPRDNIDDADNEINSNIDNNKDKDLFSSKDVFNVLLIGVDSREKNTYGRSDSMILVSINKKTEKITMTSFLRDTYVAIPGYGNNRINASYAFGRVSLLLKTIQTNFNIAIDKYIIVNFENFEEIVDILGGVDLTLSKYEAKVLLKNINTAKPTDETGLSFHLDGTQALEYARIRHGDSDFYRTSRQRTVLTALFNQLKGSKISTLNSFLEEILPHVTTNLSKSDCLSLLTSSLKYMKYDLKNLCIPVDGSYSYLTVRGMSVIKVDFNANMEAFKKAVYDSDQK